GLQLADMNGDGMLDAVHVSSGLLSYRLNLGWGAFGPWQDMFLDPNLLPQEIKLNDINGDNLADVVTVVADTVSFALNENGRTFAPAIAIRSSAALSFP